MKKILYILFSTLIVIPALAEDTGSPKITVNFIDNTGTPIKNTTVILDGKEYTTDKKGDIIISISDGNQPSNTPPIKIEGFETKSNQRIVNKTQITMTRCTSTSKKTECKCTSNDKNADTTDNNYEWNDKGKLICKINKCKSDRYKLNSDKNRCEDQVGKSCDPMPDNATKAHREYNEETQQEVCIIDECKEGYTRAPDKLSCIEPTLSEEDSNKKIEELQENADAMKEKEQSDANKLLGAASIGAMGIGGMQALSALSEQRADEDAELDMSAYLATFRCDFGQGRNIQGGQTGIVLPGGNQLFSLYNEYKTLAADLKTRKEALGLTPGIESETILDKANTGLYDDIGSGRSDGAYTSLATALSNPNSADAAEWAAQREDTATQLQRGLITVGVGAAASIIGNLAINENKKAAQESSDEIIAKFEPLKTLENDIKALPNQEANAKCPEGSTGTFPNCTCTQDKQIHNSNTNSCDTCPGDKIAIDNECQCPNGTVPGDNDTCTDTTATPQCDKADSNITVDQKTGECTCINGYIKTSNGQNCECPTDTHTLDTNSQCVENQTPRSPTSTSQSITLSTSNLFELNSSTLTEQATESINTFASKIKEKLTNETAYCINVTGHTDKTGTDKINNPLSRKRAEAVKTALEEAGIKGNKIKTYSAGSTACKQGGYQKECRKVEIEFTSSACSA